MLSARSGGARQRGAVSIEFALLFALFLVIVYSVLAYALPMLLTLSFKQVSADAARAAIRVDPLLSEADYAQVLARQVNAVVASSWLPQGWRQGDCPAPRSAHAWKVLPGSPSFGHYAVHGLENGEPRYRLDVCLQRKYNDNGADTERAIIPTLRLFTFKVPSLPADENGEVVLRARTGIQL